MTLGQTLGPYRVLDKLGEGGMGEVYRGRDTQLNRDVAIKVLPELFALDHERLARFTREAQTLAALNHPNIAQIYGLERAASSGSGQALVMELVEGEDLSALIDRGPIPLPEALPIARQIADALEAAHELGIIHRDLKPANVKVRPDGTVKVLDFGLAKAMHPSASSSANAMKSPTLTARATQVGTVIGTAAYMAPEQAKGKAVDKRADIWAFGVVLYEMLAGRQLFSGDTVSEILASVLKEDVPWTALPSDTPRGVVQLLRRCLARDPRSRLRDIGEARLTLADAETSQPSTTAQTAAPVATTAIRPRYWLAVAAGCLLTGLVAGGLVAMRWRGSPSIVADRPPRVMILPAAERTLEDRQAISPDGRWIAYTAADRLWIRNLAELDAREVNGSRGARRPFWSPKSDAVAYAAGGALFRVSTTGGTPLELCRISGGDFTGGSWSTSQGIVFTSSRANWDGEVMRVSADGGNPEVFTKADGTKGERRLADPHFLPDGQSLLYMVITISSNEGEIAIDRGGVRTLLGLGDGSTEAAWSPTGHVIFTRNTGIDTALWALPFSLQTTTRTGEPFRIATGGAGASVASGTTHVYSLRRPEPQALLRVDRAGKSLGVIAESRSSITEPRLSPDGRMITATVDFARISVWDTDRGVETRVTGEGESAIHAAWLPGNSLEIAYTRLGKEGSLVARRPDGSGSARRLLDQVAVGGDFSHDGKRVAYYVLAPETGRDLWAKDLDPPGDALVILRTKANEARPRISPDGRFVAYQSDASGRWEVYVMPFPRGEGRVQVSTGGGQHAVWNPKGGELFYVSGDDLMAVNVTLEPVLQAGRPQRLFDGRSVGTQLTRPRYLESFYSVAPDGRSFVVVKGHGTGTSDVVVADGLLTSAATGRQK